MSSDEKWSIVSGCCAVFTFLMLCALLWARWDIARMNRAHLKRMLAGLNAVPESEPRPFAPAVPTVVLRLRIDGPDDGTLMVADAERLHYIARKSGCQIGEWHTLETVQPAGVPVGHPGWMAAPRPLLIEVSPVIGTVRGAD
jgi:hypothetical protein